jgi:hypothetical protein
MNDVLVTLQSLATTQLPNLLVIGGVIFLLLAFVGRFGAFVELPRRRQMWAGIVGTLLLVFGMGLFVVPRTPPVTTTPPQTLTVTSAPPVLTVQIWDIVQDRQNTIVASGRFNGSGADETLQQVGRWVTEQITQKYDLAASPIHVHIYVPADLSKEKLNIQMVPPIPYHLYFSVVQGGFKSREPVAIEGDQAIANLKQDFDLEINPVGYTIETVHVTWGQPLDKNLTLEPRQVGIAIEEFTGERNSVATRLVNYLTTNTPFAIKDPSALKQLRDQIATEQAFIAANPAAQISIRTSLGVDLIITGTLEKP